MKLLIQSKVADKILEKLNSSFIETLTVLNKAKDISKLSKKEIINKKGHRQTVYVKTGIEVLSKLFSTLKDRFGIQEKTINNDYEKNNIQKEYGVDKQTFAAHIYEYLSNKAKWDTFFLPKENREKYKAPQKTNADGKRTGTYKNTKPEQKQAINRSLMRKVWELYNPKNKPSKQTEGTRAERLKRVKDDYVARKIDFDTALKEYTAIYPKGEIKGMFDFDIDDWTKATDFLNKYIDGKVNEEGCNPSQIKYMLADYFKLTPKQAIIIMETVKGSSHITVDELLDMKDRVKSGLAPKDETIGQKESEGEKTRSEAMMGNDNAYKGGFNYKRNIYIPKMTVNGLERILSKGKENLTDNDKEDLLDYKYFLLTHQQDAADKGFLIPIESDSISGFVPKNKFWITNIDFLTAGFESKYNLSEAMMGNDNAKKDGVPEEIAASIQMKTEQSNEKKARKKAGMPEPEIFERTSAMEDSTWNPKSKEYRYQDTGYIAGSRKELAESHIRQMAKDGKHINEKDIDWQGIEENPRQAKKLITKSNIFGKVDWENLQTNGMTGGAGFLVDRVYASVGVEPKEDNAEARRNYSIAIDGLRDRLEECKTVDEVTSTIKEISAEMKGDYIAAKEAPEVMAISEKISELYKRRHELIQGEEAITGWRNSEVTEFDRAAQEYFDKEAEKVREKDKRKKRVSVYDFSEEVREEYNRLTQIANMDRHNRRKEYQEKNGYLDSERIINDQGKDVGNRSRGYLYYEIKELEAKRTELYNRKAAEIIIANPLHLAWTQLGDKFQGVINYGSYKGSDTFHNHVSEARRGKYDNWEWTGKEKMEAGTKGQKRRADFELKVASKLDRKGGRNIKSESTLDLKNNFKLRDVQSGNWVLNDPESAKFHVDNISAGLADLGDITGIPDDLLSMNGRLAIAIGARGKGSSGFKKAAAAHYEPVERVINLTKMKGGGSLGHEWFHAFDNLISEAMTGGDIDEFLTDPYADLSGKQLKLKAEVDEARKYLERGTMSGQYLYNNAVKKAEEAGVRIPKPGTQEEHIEKVKSAFNNLVKAMSEGDHYLMTFINYTADDYRLAKINIGEEKNRFGKTLKEAGTLEKAIDLIHAKGMSNKKTWIALAVAYYDGKTEGNRAYAPSGKKGSFFKKAAVDLDAGGVKPYYSKDKEMAARAFSAYIDDKLRENGRLNDYLAYATTNEFYKDPMWGDKFPYPDGEERDRINKAFEELFKVVNESGAIRKALNKGEINMENGLLKSLTKRIVFRKYVNLDHLFMLDGGVLKKAKSMPVGTIRDWKGKKYVKTAAGKWTPKGDGQKGAKENQGKEKSRLRIATEKLGELHREGKADTPEMTIAYKEYQEAMKEARETKYKKDQEQALKEVMSGKKTQARDTKQLLDDKVKEIAEKKNEATQESITGITKQPQTEATMKAYEKIVREAVQKKYSLTAEKKAEIAEKAKAEINDLAPSDLIGVYKIAKRAVEESPQKVEEYLSEYFDLVREGRMMKWNEGSVRRAVEDSHIHLFAVEIEKYKVILPLIEKEMKACGLMPKTDQDKKEEEQAAQAKHSNELETVKREYGEIEKEYNKKIEAAKTQGEKNQIEKDHQKILIAVSKKWQKDFGIRINPEYIKGKTSVKKSLSGKRIVFRRRVKA
jgi:hypothetical protein